MVPDRERKLVTRVGRLGRFYCTYNKIDRTWTMTETSTHTRKVIYAGIFVATTSKIEIELGSWEQERPQLRCAKRVLSCDKFRLQNWDGDIREYRHFLCPIIVHSRCLCAGHSKQSSNQNKR